MKTRVCKKHREKPAIIYGKCIGCEIDLLRLEVQSLRSEKRRADVLAAALRELRDVVTSDVETKVEFVSRVRAVLAADPDARVFEPER